MTEAAEKLKPILAALPPEDRAALIDYLVALDEGQEVTEEQAEAAWAAVINRRVEEILSGKVRAIPAEEVLRRGRRKPT